MKKLYLSMIAMLITSLVPLHGRALTATSTAAAISQLREKIGRKQRKIIVLKRRIQRELDPTTRNALTNRLRGKEHRLKHVQSQLHTLLKKK